MCTLTYYPISDNHIIITTSRDENTSRTSETFPSYAQNNGKFLFFPKDGKSGGTWIASSDHGVTGCMLNGADEQLFSNPPYKKSRGLVLLDALQMESIEAFQNNYYLHNIAPFTMVIFEVNINKRIIELRWNGVKLNAAEYPLNQPQIWSSPFLFNKESQEYQVNIFKHLYSTKSINSENDLRNFHFEIARQKEEGIITKNSPSADPVKTMSITSTVFAGEEVSMIYQGINEPESRNLKLAIN